MTRPIPTRRIHAPAAWLFAIFVAACLLGGLTGCAPNPGSMQLIDENGCKWAAPIYKHEYGGDRYGAIQRVTNSSGIQVCLLGAKAGGVL